MRGTPSCSTTSACFPKARRIWQHASADPTASPSGRACEVSTKRSRCSICFRTSCSIWLFFLLRPCRAAGLALLRAQSRALQQFFHSRFFNVGTIQPEVQFRCASQAQALHQLMPYIFPGSGKPLQTSLGFRIITIDKYTHLRRPPVIRNHHTAHAHQPNPRISQLAFHQSFNFLAQGLAYTTAMILEPTLLHTSPRIKPMTISEN